MGKRTVFTNVTPLPSNVTREVGIAMLHNHDEMIELNPMVIEHHPIQTPRDAPADEFLDCVWQELTDKVNYLPGGLVKGKVSYKACFHDLPTGLQTHIYAPTGLDIREKWSIRGTLPGEPREAREMGSAAPSSGLYLQEECEMRCNRFLSGFVRKNLDHAHKVLVERILKKASLIEQHRSASSQQLTKRSDTFSPTNFYNTGPSLSSQSSSAGGFQPGSHMSQSRILQSPTLASPTAMSPGVQHRHQQSYPPPNIAEHPAFRNDQASYFGANPNHSHNNSWPSNGSVVQGRAPSNGQNNSLQPPSFSKTSQPRQVKQQFLAELPGSDPQQPDSLNGTQEGSSDGGRGYRFSVVSELSSDLPPGGTDRGSIVSDIPQCYRYNPVDFQR